MGVFRSDTSVPWYAAGRKLLLHSGAPWAGWAGLMTTKPGKFWFSLPMPYVSHDPRLGRLNTCSPVFICKHAPLWLMLSTTIERTTHRSSTQLAMFGSSSETSVPHSPCLANFHGDASRLPVLVRSSLGIGNGSGLPLFAVSIGLGSNVSTCD